MAQSESAVSEVLAIDAGGTMTDTFIIDNTGDFTVGKAKTTPEDESIGVIESAEDALSYWDTPLDEAVQSLETGVYSGTAMLNRLVERAGGDDVGVILNKGMEDNLRMGRGVQSYLGYSYNDRLHLNTHKYDEPIVPTHRVKGVTERIDLAGTEVIPVYEEEVEEVVSEFLEADVDSIAVCLLHSYVNESHEQEVRDIAESVMDEADEHVPIYLSSERYPHREEVPRMNTLVADAYAARPSRQQLENVQEAMDERGGAFDVRVMASHGGTIDTDTEELARTLVSGPIGGIVGSIDLGQELGIDNIACTDIGGTSFDMGVVTDADFNIDYRPNMARLLLSLPMVEMDSVGAGTGSYVQIDPAFDRIEIGPESAGDEVGVSNLDADVETVTVTDCHIVMGIIDPDNFLGGRMNIDPNVAYEAVESQLAEPLGMGVYETCQTVVDLLETRLSNSLNSVMSGTGHAPSNYTCLSYGGGGPVHTVGYTEDIDFAEVLVPAWAAAFSAYGCATADYEYRYDRTTALPVAPDASGSDKEDVGHQLNGMWRELEERLVEQFQPDHDREDIDFSHHFRAQYQGQLESISVKSPHGRVDSPGELDDVIQAFERAYASKYTEQARSPELGHNFTQVTVRGTVDTVKPNIPYEPVQRPEVAESAIKGERDVYMNGQHRQTQILEMDALRAGNEIEGPAIIEDPATTFVVPNGYRTRLDENRLFHLAQTNGSDRQ